MTWLVEKTSSVFVIMTANNVLGLPPEMTRRGRLDEVFNVSLPNSVEREAIWKIHLGKVKQFDNMKDRLPLLANWTDGYSGAEIEQAIHDALYDHYTPGQPLVFTEAKLKETLSFMTPLSKARKEDIEHLEKWAALNARPASLVDLPKPVEPEVVAEKKRTLVL